MGLQSRTPEHTISSGIKYKVVFRIRNKKKAKTYVMMIYSDNILYILFKLKFKYFTEDFSLKYIVDI